MRPEERVAPVVSRGIWVGRFHDFKSENGNVKKATLCRIADVEYMTMKDGSKRKRSKRQILNEVERLWTQKYQELKQGASRGPHKNTRLKFSEAAQEFLDAKAKTRDQKTVNHYSDSCNQLIECLEGDFNVHNPPRNFDTQFCDWLQKRKITDNSVNSRIRDIQACLNWLYKKKVIKTKYYLEKLRATDPTPGRFSNQQLLDMIDYMERRIYHPRDQKEYKLGVAMMRSFMMMRYTAMRAGEVRALPLTRIQDQLHIADVEEENYRVKGRQEAYLPILPELQTFLDNDLSAREPNEKWYLDNGRGGIHWSGVAEMGRPFKKMCDFLGIKGVKPLHGFRSTAISNLLDNGVSPRIVQKLARHTKIETTLSYHNDTNLQIAPQITGLI
ncbi:MAG: hypothetical protein CMC15_18130 [Flavobacteriaceae bacterium]|nr:hypothetical protein [Flavobacteriaceae bacterium]